MPPSNPPEGGSAPWDPRTGGGVPPTPLLRTETLPRVKAKTRQQRGQKNHRSPPRFAALKRRARRKVLCQAFFQESGGAWPHRTSRLLTCGKGGKRHTAARRKHANARKRYTRPSVSERPKARRKVLCQAFFQESGGAWPHRTSRLLACGKGGKRHTAARRKHANARKRYTRPSVSERPKARRKVLCQAFFQESGGRGVLQGQGHQEKSSQGPAGQVGHHGVPHGPAPPALLQQQGKYSHFH